MPATLAAVAQICSKNNVARNLTVCRSVIRRAAGAGAKFICLPEASDFIATSDEVFGLSETLKASSFVRGIRDEAKASDIWVSVGIHELSSEEDKQSETNGVNGHDGDKARERCYNTQCLISSDGEIASIYRKLHLFDVMKDGMSTQESNTTLKGSAMPKVTDTPIGKVGMLTCYDLRFPEAALILRARGAEVITYPSAWAVDTGVHWEHLLSARAIENQSYLLAAAQVGAHPPTKRKSFGKASIVDPWGTVVATCNDNTARYQDDEDEDSGNFCMAHIDLDYLTSIREAMPLWDQRRHDVYGQP